MHAAAAEEDHGDEGAGGVKAECPPSDRADLAVQAFGAGVREARSHVLEDAVQVALDSARGFGEVLEPAALGVRDPLEELVAGDVDLAAVQDVREGLLEQVAAKRDRLACSSSSRA